jgi:hypothetical protein
VPTLFRKREFGCCTATKFQWRLQCGKSVLLVRQSLVRDLHARGLVVFQISNWPFEASWLVRVGLL